MLLDRFGRGQRGSGRGHPPRLATRFLVHACVLAVAVACGRSGSGDANGDIVTMWTDIAEIAAYVEAFNVASPGTRVELVYRDSQVTALAAGETEVPDLAIGRWLNAPTARPHLAPLDGLFRDGTLEPSSFYAPLLALGASEEGRQLALPFSFTMPVVVFRAADQPQELDRSVIDVATLRRLGSEYVAGSSAGLTQIGFSPLWDVQFLLYLASADEDGLRANASGGLQIDAAKLNAVTATAREWITESHGGPGRDQEFVRAFFHQPLYQLAIEGRIRFYLTDISSYFAIPDEKRQQLDFRWLTVDGAIPVDADVRWLVKPAGSRNGPGVRAFLAWILDPAVQEELLGEVQFKRLRVFGLTDGLSALPEVNARIFPRFHEFLLGRIPEATQLRFLGPMPAEWDLAQAAVVAPWLAAAVAGTEQDLSLQEALAEWRRDLRLE